MALHHAYLSNKFPKSFEYWHSAVAEVKTNPNKMSFSCSNNFKWVDATIAKIKYRSCNAKVNFCQNCMHNHRFHIFGPLLAMASNYVKLLRNVLLIQHATNWSWNRWSVIFKTIVMHIMMSRKYFGCMTIHVCDKQQHNSEELIQSSTSFSASLLLINKLSNKWI